MRYEKNIISPVDGLRVHYVCDLGDAHGIKVKKSASSLAKDTHNTLGNPKKTDYMIICFTNGKQETVRKQLSEIGFEVVAFPDSYMQVHTIRGDKFHEYLEKEESKVVNP